VHDQTTRLIASKQSSKNSRNTDHSFNVYDVMQSSRGELGNKSVKISHVDINVATNHLGIRRNQSWISVEDSDPIDEKDDDTISHD